MPSSTSRPAWHERWRVFSLWTGLLAGPLIWLGLLEFVYVGAYVACEMRATWFMHTATAVAVLLVAVAGVLAWRARPGTFDLHDDITPPLSDHTRRQRTVWMSVAGVTLSAFFVLVILAMEIPIVVLRECQ